MIVVIIRFDHRWSKFCRVVRKSMIADSSSTLKSLNESFHDSDWLSFFSRYTRTSEFSDRLWIRIEDESFRVFNASINWRMTIDLRTLFIALRIAMNLWMIIDDETFISIMRRYVSNTSNVSIKSSRFIESFNVLKIICRIEFESISNIFATMIAYTRRRSSWYRSIISIKWWVSTKTVLILIFILTAYCLNSRTINCLLASDVIRSSDSRYVSIQQTRSWSHTCRAIIFFSHWSAWKRIVSFIKCRIDLFTSDLISR
jgi:hypothetical protein